MEDKIKKNKRLFGVKGASPEHKEEIIVLLEDVSDKLDYLIGKRREEYQNGKYGIIPPTKDG